MASWTWSADATSSATSCSPRASEEPSSPARASSPSEGRSRTATFAPRAASSRAVAPPSPEVLERRLRDRGTDDEAAIAKRLGRAAEEHRLAQQDGADIVVNDVLETAVETILDKLGLPTQAS